MSKYIVVVADTQNARLFTLKDSLTPEIESSPRLIEEQALINPDKSKEKAKPRQTPASSRNQSGSGGIYSFDNHQGKRLLDELRKFSGIIIKEALKQARKAGAHTLILVAGGKALGALLDTMCTVKQKGLETYHCDLEITGEPTAKIQAILAKRKLIPAMRKPSQRVRK